MVSRRKVGSTDESMSRDFRTPSPHRGPSDWSPYPPPYPRTPSPFAGPRRDGNRDRHRSVSPAVHATVHDEKTRVLDDEDRDGRCGQRVEEFARDTTIHGVGQILNTDQPLITRVIWTIAFIIAAVACVVLIGLSFARYLEYDVKTTTSLRTEAEIDFPAVTICNENMLSKILIGASPATITSFTGIVVSNIDEYESKRRQALLTCHHKPTQYTEQLNTAGYKWFKDIGVIKVMEIFALDSKKSLISCWWKDRPQPCSNYFLNQMTDFGWCFTLNPSPNLLKGFHLGLRRNDTGYGVNHDYELLKLRSTGPNNGFRMLMNVRQEDYCVTRTDAAGFKVLIHDPNVQPMFFLERPLSMAPGFETSVAIRYTRLEKKTADLGKCVEFKPLSLFPTAEIYFKEACYMECYTWYIYNNCSCAPLYGPPRANYRLTDLTGKAYVPVCWAPHEVVCMKKRERDFLDKGLSRLCGDCVEPCKYTNYDIQVSTAYFPADNFHYLYDEVLNATELHRRERDAETGPFANKKFDHDTYIRRNLVLANFYVESMQINVIEETHAFTADQLVADVGGQVGFLLGMSMLSLFEFLQCLIPRKKVEKRGRKRADGRRGGGNEPAQSSSHETAYRKRY